MRIFWRLEIDDEEKEPFIYMPAFPDFDGAGIAKCDDEHYKKGDLVPYGIGFSMHNYVDLPLILEKKVQVWYSNQEQLKEYDTCDYTLYQVILSVIWEISFHGSPKDTENFISELRETAQRIINGEEELLPLESLFEEEESNDCDKKFSFQDVLKEYQGAD